MYKAPKNRDSINVFKEDDRNKSKPKEETMDFPEWNQQSFPTSLNMKENTLNYIHATHQEKIKEEKKEDELKEGTIRLSWDKGKMIVEGNNPMKKMKKPQTYHEYVYQKMDALFLQWEEYKQNYIEMYGEDVYSYYREEEEEEEPVENENEFETSIQNMTPL